MNDSDYYTYEDRYYVNPQTGANEVSTFVDNLRNVQQTNTDQINRDTYNLGTHVPSNTGGLSGANGANSYWASRYSTPVINATAANLRATAQANAFYQMFTNWQNQAQKRYKDAYSNYQRRAYNSARRAASRYGSSGSGSGGSNGYTLPYTYDPEGSGYVTYDVSDTVNGNPATTTVNNRNSAVTNVPGLPADSISIVQDGDWIVSNPYTNEVYYRNGQAVGSGNKSRATLPDYSVGSINVRF